MPKSQGRRRIAVKVLCKQSYLCFCIVNKTETGQAPCARSSATIEAENIYSSTYASCRAIVSAFTLHLSVELRGVDPQDLDNAVESASLQRVKIAQRLRLKVLFAPQIRL